MFTIETMNPILFKIKSRTVAMIIFFSILQSNDWNFIELLLHVIVSYNTSYILGLSSQLECVLSI